MATLIWDDILQDVSYVLHQRPVNTTVGTIVAPGVVTVTPPKMDSIYAGCSLIAGSGASREIITVSSITTTTLTATFANAHAASDILRGATFPKGNPTHSLFTQQELLAYGADVSAKFMVEVQPVFAITPGVFSLAAGRVYTQPALCMRLERISINGRVLKNTTQTNLDLQDPTWRSKTSPATPTDWFQDDVNVAGYGYKPHPQVSGDSSLWHSVRSASTVLLSDIIPVPDPFAPYLKWGVLGRCYSKDGEMRDPARGDYCDRRMDFGIMLAHKFLDGMHAGTTPKSFFIPRAFRMLAVPPPEVQN